MTATKNAKSTYRALGNISMPVRLSTTEMRKHKAIFGASGIGRS